MLLSEQMISSGIVAHLLSVLAARDIPGVNNINAAKALIVEALKNSMLDLTHGERIKILLNESQIWKEYKDQRHDLYLPAANHQAIAGPTGALGITFRGESGHTDGMFSPPPRHSGPAPPPKPSTVNR
ncbi:hypothetical protein L596_007483 [Steinernema carpocapsae]|uniref:Uncharacterized protein n=1 Tax=Steinernema carpocapsae TaxID=34508 RepID=A0A4U5PAG0_STECR|nr:hypothetical protein L596_007483 [Steinernema carpocapsae]